MKTVNCPRCNATVRWRLDSVHRPFCSARCKEMDLGAWANDEYRIPSETPLDVGDLDDGSKL